MFISFEGIDGSGKTTMLRRLEAHLQAKGERVLVTLEPGGSELGRWLRRWLLDEVDYHPHARTEALLFMADRAAHVMDVIYPALLEGTIVLCDRFCDSTLAYQGGGRGLSRQNLRQLNQFATAGLEPELTFFFDLPLEVARRRQNRDKDRLEKEDAAFYERVIAVYQELAAEQPERIRVIDAAGSEEQVFAALLSQLPTHLR